MYGLLDCNSFYASCETLFRPDLAGRPVVVLSNNDGCIIAMNPQASDLGLGIGKPYFKHRHALEQAQAAVFSANFALYGDISARVMSCLQTHLEQVEVYSIDEAFFACPQPRPQGSVADQLLDVHRTVVRWCGVPVCIGAAATKTLAKLANGHVKRTDRRRGVLILDGDGARQAMRATEIQQVWGIGRKHAGRLREIGVHTAYDFSVLDEQRVKRMMGVTGLATWRELNGEPCLARRTTPRQSIIHSRSFPSRLTCRDELTGAVRVFAAAAAARARRFGLRCRLLQVELSYPGDTRGRRSYEAQTVSVEPASNDSWTLMAAAQRLVARMHRPGRGYGRAGVALLALDGEQQTDLLAAGPERGALLDSIDRLNQRYGSATLRIGARQVVQRRLRLSPQYTTKVADVRRVS